MTFSRLLAPILLASAVSAQAAPPVYLLQDQSSAALMDKAGAQAVWNEQLSPKLMPKLAKLYPVRRWGFLSQVEGGFTDDKTCVVTARAMLLPRSGKSLMFKPAQTATTIGSVAPGATAQQCKDLARAKLVEASGAVLSSLIKS